MSSHRCVLFLVCVFSVFSFALPAEAQRKLPCTTAEVSTQHGPVCGLQLQSKGTAEREGAAVIAHLGIPFAEPPTGANRWLPPQPLDPWQQTYHATQFAPACPQWNQGGSSIIGQEDCLYLNVWAPQNAQNLPVMVWIYGGAFVEGGAFYPLFDGTNLASVGNVVVVDFNYRLGVLGFLAAGSPINVNGNYGFLDQQAALTWVKNNIASFGGDPTKVTIFGESAGAMSTGLHLLSAPASKSLFRAGVMQSNPLALSYQTLANAQTSGSQFIQQKLNNCSTLSCLQGLTMEQVLNAQGPSAGMTAGSLTWGPVIDQRVITAAPLASFGSLNKPLLLGTNHDEGTFFVDSDPQIPNPLLGWEYTQYVIPQLFPNNTAAVLQKYPAASGDNRPLLSQLLTDYLFTCPNRYAAENTPAAQKAYAYQFNEVSGFAWPLPGCADYVCHGAELPYVFSTANSIHACGDNGTSTCKFTIGELLLSVAMIDYWSSFAANLQPKGSVSWPVYNQYLLLNTFADNPLIKPSGPDPFKDTCCFWENLNFYGPPSPACSSGSKKEGKKGKS